MNLIFSHFSYIALLIGICLIVVKILFAVNLEHIPSPVTLYRDKMHEIYVWNPNIKTEDMVLKFISV